MLTLSVVTPEGSLFKGDADFVAAPDTLDAQALKAEIPRRNKNRNTHAGPIRPFP